MFKLIHFIGKPSNKGADNSGLKDGMSRLDPALLNVVAGGGVSFDKDGEPYVVYKMDL